MEGYYRHQRNFRVLLSAMSRPGKLRRLETLELSSAVMAVAECLLDHEVSFCLVGGERAEERQAEIVRETGSRPAGLPEADFVFVCGGAGAGMPLAAAKRGRPESPEEAATLVVSLDDPVADPSERPRFRLKGPGIPEAEGIAPEMPGIPPALLRELARFNADFPLGVDSIFIRPNGDVMCLPRSTEIRAVGAP